MDKLRTIYNALKEENKDMNISFNHWVVRTQIAFDYSLENRFYPIKIGNKNYQFKNVSLISKSSGDTYYLVEVNGYFEFFGVAYEPDCDGEYYYHQKLSILEVVENMNDFQIRECYTHEILKDLQKL
jgi:thioredoxin reductase